MSAEEISTATNENIGYIRVSYAARARISISSRVLDEQIRKEDERASTTPQLREPLLCYIALTISRSVLCMLQLESPRGRVPLESLNLKGAIH